MTDKQNKVIKRIISGTIVILLIITWAFIVREGINRGKKYIDDAIDNVEMRNIENHQRLLEQNSALNLEIKDLNEEILTLRNELNALNNQIGVFSTDVTSLKDSIGTIDATIGNSIDIQNEIGQKISTLENRLAELKNSLDMLLEGPQ